MGSDALRQAREAYARCRWNEAYEAFHQVEDRRELTVDDLTALADAAWWLGRTDESLGLSEEVYRHHVKGERAPLAARTAVEIGFLWLLRGEATVGSGWIGRAGRLLADAPECAEQGYLLYLEVEEAKQRGDPDRAVDLARRMQQLGEQHDDATLHAIGLVAEGIMTIERGRVDAGLAVLDEAMLPVHAGRVAPSWTGNLYCQLMSLFMGLADIPRARAWTEATERWCDGFSNAAMFRGICRVHRAQLLGLEGDWTAAEARAAQACQDLADMNLDVVAEGNYQIGELRRRQGDHKGAESAYLRANEFGRDPQPGLAMLRLAQGRADAARASLNAALVATTVPLDRAPLRAGQSEVAYTTDDAALATEAADELTRLADTYRTPGLQATARQAAGTARLLAGRSEFALPLLREACRRWRELGARYDAARVRVRLAVALDAVGDAEAAARERETARATFGQLGANPDLRDLEGDGSEVPGGLTKREAEVLEMVAVGRSNRDIASRLTISERTVERHLSNIFVKLGVASRTEAAGFAYTHGMVDAADR